MIVVTVCLAPFQMENNVTRLNICLFFQFKIITSSSETSEMLQQLDTPWLISLFLHSPLSQCISFYNTHYFSKHVSIKLSQYLEWLLFPSVSSALLQQLPCYTLLPASVPCHHLYPSVVRLSHSLSLDRIYLRCCLSFCTISTGCSPQAPHFPFPFKACLLQMQANSYLCIYAALSA